MPYSHIKDSSPYEEILFQAVGKYHLNLWQRWKSELAYLLIETYLLAGRGIRLECKSAGWGGLSNLFTWKFHC